MAEKKDAKKTTAKKAVARPAKRAVVKPAVKSAAAAAGDVASGRGSRPQRPRTTAGKAAASSETRLPSTSPAAASKGSTRAAAAPKTSARKPAAASEAAAVKREARPLPTAPEGQVPIVTMDGSVSGSLPLPAELGTPKTRAGVLFQALSVAASNRHLGTAATKNRSRVSGGGAKPWRQKGTGRARQGSTRAPHWRHGGVVFGPNGRRYARRIPDKMRREAFAEAFASRARAGRVIAYEGIALEDGGRTRAMTDWLRRLGDTGSIILVTPEVDQATARAAANARGVGVRSVGALRTSDVLTHDTLLVRRDALEALVSRASVAAGGGR